MKTKLGILMLGLLSSMFEIPVNGYELKRAKGQIARIRKSLDLKTRQLEYPHPTPKILKILRSTRADFQTLIRLAKKYPDLNLDTRPLEDELNSIEAAYDKLKKATRRRR